LLDEVCVEERKGDFEVGDPKGRVEKIVFFLGACMGGVICPDVIDDTSLYGVTQVADIFACAEGRSDFEQGIKL